MKHQVNRLAVHIPARKVDYWLSLIREAVAKVDTKIRVSPCLTSNDLQRFSPDVIIGHVSEDLKTYLSDKPALPCWVQILSVGVDELFNGIKLKPQVRVTNVRGLHNQAMAEYVIGAILYFEKKFDQFFQQKKEKIWKRVTLPLLHGKAIIIYGTGEIGCAVARFCSNFGMCCHGVSSSGREKVIFERIFELRPPQEILARVDYVVASLPLTRVTAGKFDEEFFSSLKPEAVFVNISRGALIDEEALLRALNSGTIRGAALDVFQDEPLPAESPFWSANNLILTPHIAGKFDSGHEKGLQIFVDNLRAYRASGELLTECFQNRGY